MRIIGKKIVAFGTGWNVEFLYDDGVMEWVYIYEAERAGMTNEQIFDLAGAILKEVDMPQRRIDFAIDAPVRLLDNVLILASTPRQIARQILALTRFGTTKRIEKPYLVRD